MKQDNDPSSMEAMEARMLRLERRLEEALEQLAITRDDLCALERENQDRQRDINSLEVKVDRLESDVWNLERSR